MALVTRYFSTASAGAGDGTTWADRAQLVNGSTWSTVITGFNFTSDSLLCLIGPGTHTPTAGFSTALFTSTAPNAAFRMTWAGCDSSGNALTPPDPAWTSDQPPWDDSDLPVIATTSNIGTVASGLWLARLVKFTATARNGNVLTIPYLEWCVLANSTNNSSANGILPTTMENCVVSMTGAAYDIAISSAGLRIVNCRVKGATGSSGNRKLIGGFTASASHLIVDRCTCIGGQYGIHWDSSTVNSASILVVDRCTVVGAGTTGIHCEDSASSSGAEISSTVVVNSGTSGIDINSGVVVGITNCRLRDNTTNVADLGSGYESDNYVTDATDADDFNDPGTEDYRILASAGFADRAIGVSQMAEEAAADAVAVGWGSCS